MNLWVFKHSSNVDKPSLTSIRLRKVKVEINMNDDKSEKSNQVLLRHENSIVKLLVQVWSLSGSGSGLCAVHF